MKKIIINTLLIFTLIFWLISVNNTYAEWIEVKVTEKIPGAGCWEKDDETGLYTCTVEPWMWSIITMMWKIIKFFTYLAWLGAVLFIVINWILYSMWWADPSLKDDAKKRIVATLIWIVLLLLSWVILNLIAPWIYK